MNWDPVRRALDEHPATMFVRDDDAGWADEELWALLDVLDETMTAIDVAVIPGALHPRLAAELAVRARAGAIRLHQHGYAHLNHEPSGRKHEFGPSRTAEQQAADLVAGRALLQDAFGDLLDPVFTPPWNRCTQATADALVPAGLTALSRDHTAAPLRLAVPEIPVTVDWFGTRKGVRIDLAARLAEQIAGRTTIGLMLHHAVTDAAERAALAELMTVLVPRVQFTSLRTEASIAPG